MTTMATLKALALPELLDIVLHHLVTIPRKNFSSPTIMRPNHSLVACLYVNKLWFSFAKDILWAHVPDVGVLAQLEDSRLQLYADSVQSLLVSIRGSPLIVYTNPPAFVERTEQAYMGMLRKLSFPKLKYLYVTAPHGISGWLNYLVSLPVGCTAVDIRLPSASSSVAEDTFQLQQCRLCLVGPERTSSFVDQPDSYFSKKMQRVLQQLDKCFNLRQLSMFGIPAPTLIDFWEYVSERRGLRSVSASFPGQFEGVVDSYYKRWSPPEPSFYADLEAVMDLSHLYHLVIDPCPPKVLLLLLHGTRKLETIRVNIDRRGYKPHSKRPGYFLRPFLNDVMRNERLQSLEINRHYEPDAQEYDHLTFDSEALIALSVHCKYLTKLIIGGGRSCTFTIQDSTLNLISRNLPSMRTFLLQGEATSLTIECLQTLARNWPFLADLELRHNFDFTDLPQTRSPLWPGLCRTLCTSHDRLYRDYDLGADEPSTLPEWLSSVLYHFPALEQIVVYVPRRVENAHYRVRYRDTTVADQYEVWDLPLGPESMPALKMVREPGGWGFRGKQRPRVERM